MRVTRELLLDLFDHMEWADARVWDAALKLAATRTDETLRAYLLHLHTVQRAFLDAWTDRPFNFRSDFSGTTLDGEYPTVQGYYASARAWLTSVDEAQLASPVVLPWTKWVETHLGRPPAPITLGETILQVIMHSTHHRAQANARLRAIGGDPPLVDYIAWLWRDRPRPEWVAAAS
jgi:uncharacterized damage-inducible protein DinB